MRQRARDGGPRGYDELFYEQCQYCNFIVVEFRQSVRAVLCSSRPISFSPSLSLFLFSFPVPLVEYDNGTVNCHVRIHSFAAIVPVLFWLPGCGDRRMQAVRYPPALFGVGPAGVGSTFAAGEHATWGSGGLELPRRVVGILPGIGQGRPGAQSTSPRLLWSWSQGRRLFRRSWFDVLRAQRNRRDVLSR